MDFELPEELRLLKQTVRRFVDTELIPIETESMDSVDLKPEVRTTLEAKAKEVGLWLYDVPEEHGGLGLDLLGCAVVWEELARTIALPNRGPSVFGPEVRSILYTLTETQKERYLKPVLTGEKFAAFAQTEPDAGSDPGMMRTTAVRDGDHYVINGAKRYISHAGRADFLQLVAATDRAKGSRGGLSMFLVDMDTPGISITRTTPTVMGDVTYELVFEDARIPAENIIGIEGEGMRAAQGWITGGRLRHACSGLGVAQRCIEMAATYAPQRVTFGLPLSERQAVQFMIADMHMRHAMVQTYVYQTAWKADRDALPRHESYTAKIQGTELGFFAADRCMQIHGAMGLTFDLPIARMWTQARSLLITEGSVEVMRMALARDIIRQYS